MAPAIAIRHPNEDVNYTPPPASHPKNSCRTGVIFQIQMAPDDYSECNVFAFSAHDEYLCIACQLSRLSKCVDAKRKAQDEKKNNNNHL